MISRYIINEIMKNNNKVPIKKACIPIKKKLDKCTTKYDAERCKFLKKILQLCTNRKKNKVHMGP